MNFNGVMSDRKTAAVLAILLLVTVGVRLVDIDKPYETWDEITTYAVGLNQWYNIFHLDFSQESWHTYDLGGSVHPPFGRYVYGVVNAAYLLAKTGPALFHMGYDQAVYTLYLDKSLVPGRIFSAILAAGTVLLLFLITKKYFSKRVAAISGFLFALLPVTIAQTKLEGLDAIMVFMFTLSVYLFIKGLEDRKYYYLALVATGLAFATKFNTATLVFLLPAIYFSVRGKKAIGKKHLLAIPFAMVGILVLIWPRLWTDPIGGLLANFGFWQSFGNVTEFFLGSLNHPIIYMSTYVVVTMPILLLAFMAIGIGLSAKLAKEGKAGYLIMLAWFFIPLFVYSFYHFQQAGPRYVFMIYPALAVLTALGIDWVASKVAAFFPITRKNLAYLIVPAIAFIYLISVLVAVHPFYLDYYNELVGGPKNVYDNHLFAIGQWGEGIGEAAYWLYGYAENGSTVQFFVQPRHTIPPLRAGMTDLTPFVPKYINCINSTDPNCDNLNWVMTDVPPQAEYLVENTFFRFYMNESFHDDIASRYTLIHVVEVEGAPLAWIYKEKT